MSPDPFDWSFDWSLAMTASHAGLIPAVLLEQFDDLSNFHA